MLGPVSVFGLAQFTYHESLRDIETCLRAAGEKLYHMGIRAKVSRNTLTHANEIRDWRIYHDFAQVLIHSARELHRNEPLAVQIKPPMLWTPPSSIYAYRYSHGRSFENTRAQ